MSKVSMTRVNTIVVALLMICGATKALNVSDELPELHSCGNKFHQCSEHREANEAANLEGGLAHGASVFSCILLASAKNFSLISMLALLGGLVIYSSFYDKKTQGKVAAERNQLLLSFSLFINAPSLVSLDQSRPSDAIKCLHGIRAISILSIIFFHGYFYQTFSPYGKSPVVQAWSKTRFASSLSGVNIFVDSYFVMSAALTTRSMLRELDSGKFNFLKTVFLRFMRLTPSVAAMIIFNKALTYYLHPNPSPEFLDYSVVPCEKNWWSALLHLQVYANPREMCMHTTWYLSVEWQMTVFVAPILIYVLWKFGHALVLPLITSLIAFSCAYGFNLSYQNGYIAQDFNMASNIYEAFYDDLYYPTHIRGAPFLIGIILGYHLYTPGQTSRTQRKVFRTFMWILTFMTISGPTFISVVYDIIGKNLLMNSLFIASIRTLWGISIAWLIFMCQSGDVGFLNKILSSKYWMPIGKLGFSLYLVHPVLQYNLAPTQDQMINLEFSHMLIKFVRDLILATVVAVFLHLLVEEPFSLIGKYISRDWNVDKKKLETKS